MNYKVPVCEKCGVTLKGRVPVSAKHIICFFCNNPPFDDNGDENTALKYKDKRDR